MAATKRDYYEVLGLQRNASEDEINKMVHEAEAHAEDDRRRRDEVEARNEADSAAYTAEKTLRDVGDKVSADVKSDVEAKIADVRAALATDDVSRITATKDALQQAMYKVSEQIYSAAGAGASSGPETGGAEGPDTGGSNPDDNTVEGEFKEV